MVLPVLLALLLLMHKASLPSALNTLIAITANQINKRDNFIFFGFWFLYRNHRSWNVDRRHVEWVNHWRGLWRDRRNNFDGICQRVWNIAFYCIDQPFQTRDITGLGTMFTQNANAVAITGGTISGLTSPLGVASGGTGAGYFDGICQSIRALVRLRHLRTIPSNITGLGTMSTQNASSVAITGGTMSGVAISGGTISSSGKPTGGGLWRHWRDK
jgi:hypothetical protein